MGYDPPLIVKFVGPESGGLLKFAKNKLLTLVQHRKDTALNTATAGYWVGTSYVDIQSIEGMNYITIYNRENIPEALKKWSAQDVYSYLVGLQTRSENVLTLITPIKNNMLPEGLDFTPQKIKKNLTIIQPINTNPVFLSYMQPSWWGPGIGTILTGSDTNSGGCSGYRDGHTGMFYGSCSNIHHYVSHDPYVGPKSAAEGTFWLQCKTLDEDLMYYIRKEMSQSWSTLYDPNAHSTYSFTTKTDIVLGGRILYSGMLNEGGRMHSQPCPPQYGMDYETHGSKGGNVVNAILPAAASKKTGDYIAIYSVIEDYVGAYGGGRIAVDPEDPLNLANCCTTCHIYKSESYTYKIILESSLFGKEVIASGKTSGAIGPGGYGTGPGPYSEIPMTTEGTNILVSSLDWLQVFEGFGWMPIAMCRTPEVRLYDFSTTKYKKLLTKGAMYSYIVGDVNAMPDGRYDVEGGNADCMVLGVCVHTAKGGTVHTKREYRKIHEAPVVELIKDQGYSEGTEGKPVIFYIQAMNPFWLGPWTTITITPEDPHNEQYRLKWQRIEGATSYHIYTFTSEGFYEPHFYDERWRLCASICQPSEQNHSVTWTVKYLDGMYYDTTSQCPQPMSWLFPPNLCRPFNKHYFNLNRPYPHDFIFYQEVEKQLIGKGVPHSLACGVCKDMTEGVGG